MRIFRVEQSRQISRVRSPLSEVLKLLLAHFRCVQFSATPPDGDMADDGQEVDAEARSHLESMRKCMRAGVRPGLQILWVRLRWTGRFDSDSLPPIQLVA